MMRCFGSIVDLPYRFVVELLNYVLLLLLVVFVNDDDVMLLPLVAAMTEVDDGESKEADDDDAMGNNGVDLIEYVDVPHQMNLWNRRECLFQGNLEVKKKQNYSYSRNSSLIQLTNASIRNRKLVIPCRTSISIQFIINIVGFTRSSLPMRPQSRSTNIILSTFLANIRAFIRMKPLMQLQMNKLRKLRRTKITSVRLLPRM